jgi:membrane-associated phospholipid phosphatase
MFFVCPKRSFCYGWKPLLHAAYPFFTALFIGKKYPKTVPFLILYAVGVAFAVIYLGEHYFFDVALGLA